MNSNVFQYIIQLTRGCYRKFIEDEPTFSEQLSVSKFNVFTKYKLTREIANVTLLRQNVKVRKNLSPAHMSLNSLILVLFCVGGLEA